MMGTRAIAGSKVQADKATGTYRSKSSPGFFSLLGTLFGSNGNETDIPDQENESSTEMNDETGEDESFLFHQLALHHAHLSKGFIHNYDDGKHEDLYRSIISPPPESNC
jgi:hypothetical protein